MLNREHNPQDTSIINDEVRLTQLPSTIPLKIRRVKDKPLTLSRCTCDIKQNLGIILYPADSSVLISTARG